MMTKKMESPPRSYAPQSRFRRNWEAFREFGLEHVLRVLSFLLPNWLFYYNHAVMLAADDFGPESQSNSEYQVRFAVEADGINFPDMERNMFLSLLRRGDTCAVVTRAGRIVGFTWATTHRTYAPLTGSILEPGPNAVYFFNLFVHPSERHKGLALLMIGFQAEHYRKGGRTRVYAGSEIFNKASVNLFERSGYFYVGENIYTVFLGIHVTYYRYWPHPVQRFHAYFRTPNNIECS